MKNIIFQCKKIYRQIFLYPASRISIEDIDYDAYWKDKRGEKIGSISRWQRQRADIVIERIKNDRALTIVDVGCGDGSVVKYIQVRTNVARAIGVDVSEFALNKAKEFGLEIIHADVSTLKNFEIIPEADHVLLFEILEHLQDSELFLTRMEEKAKKGVFFSIPNIGFFSHRIRLLFGKFPLQWRLHPREHVRFWTLADLHWWMKALGYHEYEVVPYEGIPILNRFWPSLFAAGLLVYIQKKA